MSETKEKRFTEIVAGPNYYKDGSLRFGFIFKHFRWHNRPRVDLQFKWFDLWVGAYPDIPNRTWYICPLPMVVIKIYPKVQR